MFVLFTGRTFVIETSTVSFRLTHFDSGQEFGFRLKATKYNNPHNEFLFMCFFQSHMLVSPLWKHPPMVRLFRVSQNRVLPTCKFHFLNDYITIYKVIS